MIGAVSYIAALAFWALSILPATAQSTFYDDIIATSRQDDFPPLSGAWALTLPQDHLAHPDAWTETWAVAASLQTPDGSPLALQVSFSRLGLKAKPDGAFDPTAFFRADAILSRPGDQAILAAERFSRGLGAAGHDQTSIWTDNWSLTLSDPQSFTLDLPLNDTPISLTLSLNAPRQQDPDGATPIRGYSSPRAAVTGQIGDQPVTGTAWFDHFWGEVPLPGGPLAYDRLILHLDDGSALTLLRSRRRDGAGIAALDGALIGPDRQGTSLDDQALDLTPTANWSSEDGAGRYPVAWRLAGAGLILDIAPFRDDQRAPFLAPIWSGGVTVTGTKDGQPVTGTGILQLSGYEE